MQASHLVTPAAPAAAPTHQHHLNNNNNNSYHYNPHFHNTSHSNNNNHHTMSYTPHEQTNTFNSTQPTHHHHTSATATNTNTTNSNTPTAAHKYAPARRLAARQTLRLQIPKQQGDSYGAPSTYYKHSPSQLPPAPILKRHQTPTPTTATHQHHASASAFPKSASPLESHKLPNVVCSSVSPSSQLSSGSSLYYNGSNGGLSIQTATATPTGGANKFLHLRKPSITLNSADVRNNNGNSTGSVGSCGSDLFSFTKELSPSMDISDHSPIFAEIASSISPSTSSGCSPTHHINRLFSLSPSTIRSYGNMSDFSDSSHSGVSSPASSLIENFHKKNGNTPTTNVGVGGGGGVVTVTTVTTPGINGLTVGNCNGSNGLSSATTTTVGRHINTSSSSSVKETSSTSQHQVVNSSTTTRVEKKRLHHITSSSSSSTSSSSTSSSEMKTAALKRDLSEIKNSMSEITDLVGRNTNNASSGGGLGSNKNLAISASAHQPSINDLTQINALNSSDAINKLKKKIRSSIENLVDSDAEPLVTFPDTDDDHHNLADLVSASNGKLTANGLNGSGKIVDTVKFEEKRTKTESKTKVVADGFSTEQATSNLAEMKRLQTGDIDYQEAKAAAAMRNRTEMDGVKTEENAAVIQEALSLRTGDITQQASNNVAAASIKVQSDTFSADKKAISQSQQSQTMTSNGIISQEKHMSSASQANYTMTHKGVSSSGSSMISSSSQMSATNGALIKLHDLKLDDLKALTSGSGQREIEQAIAKYSRVLTSFVNTLEDSKAAQEKSLYLEKINEVMQRAWAVPTHGHELGYSLCNSLRNSGGLDLLMKNCVQGDMKIKFSSAKLLEQCLTTENRTHVVDNGLDKVVNVACMCTKEPNTEHSRVGTGILEHLFKHSEGTCSDVIKLGGLDAVLFECRTNDVETLRHCASALANLSLYGGAENQEAMIFRKVPMWLFPLAFHDDDNIKYYACLAIAVLVANKEIEAEVLKSGCLDLVEPFVTTHDPSDFARSNLAHAHGQSKHWLERLVPVLSSNREEARNLAAFHFCMEAGIKREQGNTEIFRDIGAIEALKTVASCPNAIASKFAAQALRLIGETVPHKLSQQVPLWSVEDVQEWVKQINFGQFVKQFEESQVDGDLLLKLNEENLRDDIGIANGILLKRFERELQNLKRMADYSSKDTAKMHHFLAEIGSEYCTYTYAMLNAGIDRNSLPQLNEDMLIAECGIKNSIHRLRILNAVKNLENSLPSSSEENMAKTLDVFVSYRRSNGSQLASLLKVHLQLRGFSVFIDVERLEAGKFDNGLLNSIRQAKNFVLVLTPNALQRCVDDDDGKDWVHREIVAALKSNCNIIPIIDQQFTWPETDRLPEDMRSVCHFNGVTWIHDYQDACIDKLERFMRGEKNLDRLVGIPSTPGSVTYQRMHSNDSDYQQSVGGGSVGGGGSGVVCVSGAGGAANSSGQAANHQANRYRQSPSPARQRIGGSCGPLGSNGQLSMFGRGSKRNLITPYRTQQTMAQPKALLMGGSMQNMSPAGYRPPRRSSASGINNANSNGASAGAATNYRSHSVDELLDTTDGLGSNDRIADMAARVTAGSTALTNASSTSTLQPGNDYASSVGSLSEFSSEAPPQTVARREKSANIPTNAQHRKSRSLDHFLDDKTLALVVASQPQPALMEGTQSMQNLATPATPDLKRGTRTQPLTQRGDSVSTSSAATTPEPADVGLRKAHGGGMLPVTRRSPEGVSSTDDTQSLRSSNTSCGSMFRSQVRASAHTHRGSQNSGKTSSTSLSSNAPGNNTHSNSSNNNNANNKTILNRTIKKVRSLMKNNDLDDDEIRDLILTKTTTPSSGRIIFW
ncbi:NAD(+) hydrolase sarm1 isoform X5 [Bactrocera dorsalis]|uniref:ADP-ribosyl cyclase/cyclic ADP-ribose hydrolase n=1 Tax=Bactrocera dorsalis TaxID=27457 RepID=A0ABM3JZD6_BACDO|nr:NAD(+) hydrolase sarm1 isoform X5 [Bactrocera dorsalis]